MADRVSYLRYLGFEHLSKGKPAWNPAQLLVLALSQQTLDARVAEALPWLALYYPELNWNWVRREAKLRDLQNRLGFTLSVAGKLAMEKKLPETAALLEVQENVLRGSLLAKEDTYCNEGMTRAERAWLQTNRSPEAVAWHVLSDMETKYLTHA